MCSVQFECERSNASQDFSKLTKINIIMARIQQNAMSSSRKLVMFSSKDQRGGGNTAFWGRLTECNVQAQC